MYIYTKAALLGLTGLTEEQFWLQLEEGLSSLERHITMTGQSNDSHFRQRQENTMMNARLRLFILEKPCFDTCVWIGMARQSNSPQIICVAESIAMPTYMGSLADISHVHLYRFHTVDDIVLAVKKSLDCY